MSVTVKIEQVKTRITRVFKLIESPEYVVFQIETTDKRPQVACHGGTKIMLDNGPCSVEFVGLPAGEREIMYTTERYYLFVAFFIRPENPELMFQAD